MRNDLVIDGQSLLKILAKGTAGHVGIEFFENLVMCIIKAVDVQSAIVTECVNDEKTRLKTIAYAKDRLIKENIEYDTAGTPCHVIMTEKDALYVPHEVQKIYPAEEGVESYVGVPILDNQNEVLGHIAVLDQTHFNFSNVKIDVLKIFAARCAAEIKRIKAERQLKVVLEENIALKSMLSLENSYLRSVVSRSNIYTNVTTQSKAVQGIIRLVSKVAKTRSTVLLTGETGTGKGVFAETIHEMSDRSDRAIVKVNCAALPKELIESELFGHERGAFTGAIDRKIGKFEVANGGTIFLDEVGELPLEQQVKLLKVLQEKEFERIGGNKTIKTDVRVIAATNKDLVREVEAGSFRRDLYYRLNVFPVHLPPLRERKEDLKDFIAFFIEKHCQECTSKPPEFDKRSLKQMNEYHWPGNIRELENVVERALILYDGKKLSLDLIPLQNGQNPLQTAKGQPSLEEIERQYIKEVLMKANYKVSGPNSASEILQVNPNTLYSKMKKLGIK